MREEFELPIGSIFSGTYRVLDFIGEGGMGVVYRVEHLGLGKQLALKIVKTSQLSDIEKARFQKEAQAIARLDHRNIVKIYDYSKAGDGRPFYTMDLLNGESLSDYLRENKRMPLVTALPILLQICEGLAYAHERGIVHRDIKPSNIVLTTIEGNNASQVIPKLVDFGIVKIVDHGGQTIQGLTAAGQTFGSPLYMSPEQGFGTKVDARSDIYSLGITFYQLLTGVPPFLGENALATLTMHQSTSAPKLCDLAHDVSFPVALEQVIAAMLAKEPDDRPQTLHEVRNKLLRVQSTAKASPQNSAAPNWRDDTTTSGGSGRDDTTTSGGSESHDTTTLNRLSEFLGLNDSRMMTVILGLGLVLIAGAVAALVIYSTGISKNFTKVDLSAGHPASSQPPNQGHPLIETDAVGSHFEKDAPMTMTKSEASAVQQYLQGNPQPISSPSNRVGFKRFDFPTQFSLGRLEIKENRKTIKVAARNSVEVPVGAKLRLMGNHILSLNPQLLNLFRSDDLHSLRLFALAQRDPSLAANLAHLSSLTAVDLSNTHFDNSDLTTIEEMPNLQEINVNSCDVTGRALANSKLLPRLLYLYAQHFDDLDPVVSHLNPNLQSLTTKGSILSAASYAKLSQLQFLERLSLRDSNITDEELTLFEMTPELRSLTLAGCERLTPRSLLTLSRFRKLKDIRLPEALATAEAYKALQLGLPNTDLRTD